MLSKKKKKCRDSGIGRFGLKFQLFHLLATSKQVDLTPMGLSFLIYKSDPGSVLESSVMMKMSSSGLSNAVASGPPGLLRP